MTARSTSTVQRLVTGALALVTATGLAACSSSSTQVKHRSTSPDASPSSPAAPTVSPPPKFSGTKHPLPTGAATKNDPALYKNVALTGCSATAHGWKGSGTAKNTTGNPIDVAVLVLFTDTQARDIDSATTTVHVAPGGTAHWAASRSFQPPKSVQCVVRAVHAG